MENVHIAPTNIIINLQTSQLPLTGSYIFPNKKATIHLIDSEYLPMNEEGLSSIHWSKTIWMRILLVCRAPHAKPEFG
jgi:hypothetical protein